LHSRWKILLVEDDEDDYILTHALLSEVKPGQFELKWVDSYEGALAACEENDFDVFLVDYRLGRHDGLELAHELVRRGYRAPVILMTGQGSYDVDLKAMKAGATDYLVKNDLNPSLLERTIRYAIERRHAEEALRRAQEELEIRVLERTEELRLANEQLARTNRELMEEINERKRAQEALAESETRFRKLAETTSSAIFIVQDMRIRYANPAARMITGYSSSELRKMYFWEIAHPSYQEILKQGGLTGQWVHHNTASQTERLPVRYELKLLTKNGQERWADVTAGSIDYEGRPALVVTAFDITERDLAEQELRKAKSELEARVAERTSELRDANQRLAQANERLADINEKLEDTNIRLQFELRERHRAAEEARRRADEINTVFAAMTDAVVIYNADGSPLRANPAAINDYGFDTTLRHEDIIARLAIRRLDGTPVTQEEFPSLLALKGKSTTGQRFIFRNRLNQDVTVVVSASPLVMDGKIHGAVTVWHDVSEIESLLAQLETEQAKLKAIIENAPEAIVVTDEQCNILLANLAAERLFARPIPYNQGYQVFADLHLCYPDGTPFPPRDLPLTRSALDGETHTNVELVMIWPDQQKRDLLASTAPIFDRDGKVTGAVAIFQDITQRKRSEEEMRAQVARLEVQQRLIAQRERERLTIAQDLHDGPLQELISINLSLSKAIEMAQQESLKENLRSLQAVLQKQISELRAFSSELRPPTLVPLGLEKAIRSHAETFAAKNPDIEIRLQLAHDGQRLPETVRLALFRIYLEAVNNVVRHAQAKHVCVRFELDNGSARLEIEDDGRGFTLPNDWVAMARKGHLGLVGVQERAEAAGGTVTIQSAPNKGTLLRVVIPREE